MNNYRASLKYHAKAKAISLKTNNDDDLVNDFNNISVVYEDMGKYPEAKKALDYCLNKPNLKRIILKDPIVLANYARHLFALNEFKLGFPYATKALAISRRQGLKRVEQRILGSIGTGYFYKNDFKNAALHFSAAKDIAARIGDTEGMEIMLNNVAACMIYLGEFTKALEYYDHLIDLIGFNRFNATKLSNYSFALYNTGKTATGKKYIKKAIEKAKKRNEIDVLAGCYLIYGKFLVRSDPKKAVAVFLSAENIYRKNRNKNRLSIIYDLLGDLYYSKKDLSKTMLYYEKALDLKKIVFGINSTEYIDLREKLIDRILGPA